MNRDHATATAPAVTPQILADALEHIAKVAARSTTQTRRIRWIQTRAEGALAGNPHAADDCDLPRQASEESQQRVRQRLDQALRRNAGLLHALQALHRVCLDCDLEAEAERPTEDEYQTAMNAAELAIAIATGEPL